MRYRPPGTLRVLRVLAWTALLRLLRAARIARGQRQRQHHLRVATPRKRGDALLLLIPLMLPLFVFQALLVSSRAVQRLGVAMQHTPADADTMLVDGAILAVLAGARSQLDEPTLLAQVAGASMPEGGNPLPARIVEHFHRHGLAGFRRAPAPPPSRLLLVQAFRWPNQAAASAFAGAGALLLLSLLAMLIALGFGGANATLAGGGWTQAWLMTFPVATRSLTLARAMEYSLVQIFPWLVFGPLLLQLLRALGQPGALPIAIAGTLLTTFLTGSLRLWLETMLRLRFSLRTLRSIQGACTLLALLLLAGVFGICLAPEIPHWFLDLARSTPAWASALPAAWPLLLARDQPLAALPGALASVVVFALACIGTTRLLAHGAMRSSGVDPGARGRQGNWARSTRRLGVVGKDLALLLRDRNFLVQTMVVPLFVIGLQLVVNPSLGSVRDQGVASLAYGIGCYALIGGCFQVLSAEGRALWMLYTLPLPIAEVLRRKVRIWAGTAAGFAIASLLVFTARAGDADAMGLLADLLFVGAGVWCAAHIAAGIGILGTDPAADYVPRQPKTRHVYLYFFFAATYFLGLQSAEPTLRITALLVFATLAFAVWRRACERVPWLLDPVDDRRPGIGVYDGGAAIMVFFALQALALLVAMGISAASLAASLRQQVMAFAVAGAITVFLFLMILRLRGVDLVAGLGQSTASRAEAAAKLAAGSLAGLLAGVLALGYVYLAQRTGWIVLPAVPSSDRLAVVLLAVVAAPLFEEVIFRGLLLQGLLASVRLPLAVVWSAALFAAVHPWQSWLPVFVLGVVTALVFTKTRYLPAAMAAHAVYNLVVVGLG